MVHWWIVPLFFVLAVLMITFWITTTRESYCELLAAAFLILMAPVAIGLWAIFYVLSFLPFS